MEPQSIAPLTDLGFWARDNGILVVLYVLGAVLAVRFVTWLSRRVTARIDAASRDGDSLVRSERSKHRHSVAQVLTYVSNVLIWSVTAVLLIGRLGVPIGSLIAPATVAGVALGFGAQRVVQDLLAGFFLIAERQYGFGDVVRIAPLGATTGVTGTVEDLTLRITQLRTSNGEVVIVPNGQIVQVTNLSRDWARAVVDVPVPVSVDVNRVNALLREVGERAYADPELRPVLLDEPSVMGIESFEVGTVNIRMVARTLPGKQFEVGRLLRAQVALAFQQNGLRMAAEPETTTAGVQQ